MSSSGPCDVVSSFVTTRCHLAISTDPYTANTHHCKSIA